MAARAIAMVGSPAPGIDLATFEAPADKIIAETAMLLRSVASIPDGRGRSLASRARALALELLPHARHDRVLFGLALHPALARDYACAHVVLARMGYPNPTFERALAAAAGATTARARERLPHRELEQEWLSSLAGGDGPTNDTLQRTALARGVDLLTGSRDDVYALTHTLMYATDFGNRSLASVLRAGLIAVVQSALAGALDDDDFDLAAELLLAWPFAREPWDEIASFAFAVLAGVEDAVGVLPSLALGAETVADRPMPSRAHAVTAATYHTAFTMGFLCATLMRADPLPVDRQPRRIERPAYRDQLLAELATEGRRPQWLVRALQAKPSRVPASLLIDVALRRATRRFDLDDVRRHLQDAIANGATASPLASQAAALLRRISECAPSIASQLKC
jgi:uncharacterized protein DUF6895